MTEISNSTITEWAHVLAKAVMTVVAESCNQFGACSIMLTGGRSTRLFYKTWAAMPEFTKLKNVKFYFGDERCVLPDHAESNYGLAMRVLFKNGVPPSCTVIRIQADLPDSKAAAKLYETQLPRRLDVLLLSMGEDGHIASLFPYSSALDAKRQRVVDVLVPTWPFKRLTITPCLIAEARHVFVMALGKTKATTYSKLRLAPQDIAEIPARLVLNATWFLDSAC